MLTILWLFGIWSKLERWKSLIIGCLVSKSKKWFWSVVFSYSVQQLRTIFFFFLDCDAWLKVGFFLIYFNWRLITLPLIANYHCDYQPSGWTEKRLQSTSQRQTYTRKGRGHHLSICCWSDPLQLFKSPWDHSESAPQIDERGTEICKASSWHSFPWQRPTTCLTTNTSEVEWIRLRSFASSATFI